MSTISKDAILAVVKQHSFIVNEDQQKELDSLADAYLPIVGGFLHDYMAKNNLCYQEDEKRDTKTSKTMALACMISILYSVEKERKSRPTASLVASSRQIQSESVGAYSHSFDNTVINMMENSPLSIFLKGSLRKCPDVVAVHNIQTCECQKW